MTRVLSAVALAALVLAIVSLLPPHATLLLAVLASAVAFAEYVDLAAAVGARIPIIPSGAAVAAACVSVGGDGPPLELVCLAAAIVIGIWIVARGRPGPEVLRDAAASLFPILYIGDPARGAGRRPIHRRTRCDAAADWDDRGQRFGAVLHRASTRPAPARAGD